jgi:hypothetical protein
MRLIYQLFSTFAQRAFAFASFQKAIANVNRNGGVNLLIFRFEINVHYSIYLLRNLWQLSHALHDIWYIFFEMTSSNTFYTVH